MRSSLSAAIAAVTLFLLLGAGSASGLTLRSCKTPSGFLCTTVTVPVSREGFAPGTSSVKVAVLPSPLPSESAVVALAGGPGQAALPFARFIAQAVAPALDDRSLIVFDQRGTGESEPLSCRAISLGASSLDQLRQRLGECAGELGPRRAGYTTAETVRDINAIREALGVSRLVLYGTSYGTKVALRYAETYPDQVEALLLDSVVPPNGPEPFFLPSFEAVGPVLRELCSAGACRGVAQAPVQEVATLAARLHHAPLRGYIFNGRGRREPLGLDAASLFDLLLAGDLNPALRALFPAALTAALRGESAPLLQLEGVADGLLPTLPPARREHVEEAVNSTVFWTTSCEEDPFPWERSAPPQQREREAAQALMKLPEGAFYPFFRSLGMTIGPLSGCIGWPNEAPAPSPLGPLPNVPTLILSGAQDLRTPTAQARAVAARIPDAQVLVVPYTGHSVLGSDLSGCAEDAVTAFFEGRPVASCPATTDPFAPTPIPPSSLSALKPLPGVRGRAGKTATAVLDTILGLARIAIAATLQAEHALPAGASFGGLYGGYARFTKTGLLLHRYSYVPGVKLSGKLPLRDGKLVQRPLLVSGSAAARGRITLGEQRVRGVLGGIRFSAPIDRAVLSRVRYSGRGVAVADLWEGRAVRGTAALAALLSSALPALFSGYAR